MKKIHKKPIGILFILVLIAFAEYSYAQGGAGTFLRREVGSAPLAMGGAYTAVTSDINSIYWNPAGLPYFIQFDRSNEIQAFHSFLTYDRIEQAFSYAHVFPGLFTFGIGFYQFGVDDIDGRDIWGFPTENFSDLETYFSLAIGKRFEWFSLGFTGKYLSHSLQDYSATGIALDFGIIADVHEYVTLGATVQNVLGTLSWDTESGREETIPMSFKFGGLFEYENIPVRLALDGEYIENADFNLHAGIEVELIRQFGLRAGWDGDNPTFGGYIQSYISYYWMEFEYAATKDIIEANYIHHLTVKLGFVNMFEF